MLDEKRRALLRERARLQPLATKGRRDWERRAREAETWLQRAAILGGERSLEAASEAVAERTLVEVKWRQILGTRCPSESAVSLPDASLSMLGGSSALLCAAEAHRNALESAARFATVRSALERIENELELTRRRSNAVEHRWIPRHERALAALDLSLEELEREDAARVRWVTRNDGR